MKGLTAIALLLAGCAAEPDAPTAYRQAQELIGDRPLRSLSRAELVQAERLAGQARALDPELHEATFALAALYVARGAYEDATALYRSLVEVRPDDGRVYAELGLSLAAQGRYSGALRAYQDAARRGEKSALIYARLGHAYQALGHLQENLHAARAAYRASLQLVPEQAEVRYQLARVEARLGQDEEARTLMQQALDAAPEDTGIRADLAVLYREAGQRQLARAALVEGLATRDGGDEEAVLHYELGRLLWEEGDGAGALAQFERAQVADPDLHLVYHYLGLIHSAEGRLDSARAAFVELASRQPSDAAVQVSIGIVHSRTGALAEAEEAFKAAIALGGAEGDAALKLGGLYVHQRRLRAAVQVFKKATTAHPHHAELFASLGDVYRQLGLLGAAVQAGEEGCPARTRAGAVALPPRLDLREIRSRPSAGRVARVRIFGKGRRARGAAAGPRALAPANLATGGMMIDLVAFDLDGTVLDSEGRLAASAVTAIEELIVRGIPTASVSGRSIRRGLYPFTAYPALARALYIGGYNGSVVLGPGAGAEREVLREERLDEASFAQIVEYGRAEGLNLIYCLFERTAAGVAEEYRYVRPMDYLESFEEPGMVLDVDLYARCQSGELGAPPKVMLEVEPERREQHIADIEALCGDQIYVAWANPGMVEFMRRGVNKGVALQTLTERVGGCAERVLAIGDANNDLPMLRAAGIGVLLGNAKDEVKAAVAGDGVRIGPAFAEDGFAKMVREYALDGQEPK